MQARFHLPSSLVNGVGRVSYVLIVALLEEIRKCWECGPDGVGAGKTELCHLSNQGIGALYGGGWSLRHMRLVSDRY